MLIIPEQIRAARALLRLDQTKLAYDAGISIVTLRRLEETQGLSKVAPATVETVRRVLENAGVEFIDRGVRRSAPSAEAIIALKEEINTIVDQSTEFFRKFPPLNDKELYNEIGI